ncbi:MAG: hypothetical protein ACK4GJ_01680 [bacterium]
MEGYGVRIQRDKEEKIVGKMLAKLISLVIKEKKYFGIEIEGLEDSPFEGYTFATVYEKDGQDSYYLVKTKGAPAICMRGNFSYGEDIPEYFDKKNIEPEYEVNLSIWKFIGEEDITLESEKKIEVPTYLVLNQETIGNISRAITFIST